MSTHLFQPLSNFNYEKDKLANYYYDKFHTLMLYQSSSFGKEYAHRGTLPLTRIELGMFPQLTASLDTFFKNETTRYFGRFFMTLPLSTGHIHVDMATDDNIPRVWALNIPILNCTNNFMEWFNMGEIEPSKKPKFKGWFWESGTEGQLIEKYELSTPSIVRVAIPHRINNPIDNYRIVLSIRTMNNTALENYL